MMLHSISTGSSGNCYALEMGGKYLLLDCGVPYMEIARSLNFKMLNVHGCLLTHEHGDHSKGAKEMARRGIKMYMSKGTSDALKIDAPVMIVERMKPFSIGPYDVIPFDIPHDANEPFGFLIKHPEFGILAFITDAMYCRYQFPGLTHALIETNYSNELIQDEQPDLKVRIKHSHMSIDTCIEFLKINSTNLRSVTLLHLSDRNSNEVEFKTAIQRELGIAVNVASRNQKINLEL